MRYSRPGIAGLAAGLACVTVISLVPGAHATNQPSAGASVGAPQAASTLAMSAAAPGALETKVRGTFGRSGTVRGTFEPSRFVYKRGDVHAVGTLHALMRKGDGTLVGQANRQVSIPVRNGQASAAKTCDILHLVLGPLDLNLLGLKVHLNRVVLDITAVSGAGNLLGNLLCAVAGLLDGTSTLTDLLRLANILNRILSLLRV